MQPAALNWRVPAVDCTAESGHVAHRKSHRELPFGALFTDAARLPVPTFPHSNHPRTSALIGQRRPLIDAPDTLAGRAVYGIRLPIRR